MAGDFNQKIFNQWQELRKQFKEAKRSKNYDQIIKLSKEIIELDKIAKFICIMTPIFYKEIGAAYEKLGDPASAVVNYRQARDGFVEYRKFSDLNKPDDWLKDIHVIEKKIEKMRS